MPKVNFHLIEQKRVWAERNEDNIGYLVNNYVKMLILCCVVCEKK